MIRVALLALSCGFLLSTDAPAQFLPRTGAGSGGGGSFGGGAPGAGPAAPGGIGAPPTSGGFSPYLNLTRGGNSAAVNYYGIVRPQVDFANSIGSLQQQQRSIANSMEPDDPTMPFMVVGTRARFLNTGGYFLNLNGSAGAVPTGAGSTGFGSMQGQFSSGAASGLSSAVGNGTGMLLGVGGGTTGNRGTVIQRGGRR